MACETSIDKIAVVKQSRTLMMYSAIERSHRIVSGHHAFQIDREVRSLRKVHRTDGVNVVSAIWATSWTIEVLIDVSLGCQIPCVLSALLAVGLEREHIDIPYLDRSPPLQ